MEHWWRDIDTGIPKYFIRRKFHSMPLCLPQIPDGLAWDQTRVSAVNRPLLLLLFFLLLLLALSQDLHFMQVQ
jgi:hypothetical protein